MGGAERPGTCAFYLCPKRVRMSPLRGPGGQVPWLPGRGGGCISSRVFPARRDHVQGCGRGGRAGGRGLPPPRAFLEEKEGRGACMSVQRRPVRWNFRRRDRGASDSVAPHQSGAARRHWPGGGRRGAGSPRPLKRRAPSSARGCGAQAGGLGALVTRALLRRTRWPPGGTPGRSSCSRRSSRSSPPSEPRTRTGTGMVSASLCAGWGLPGIGGGGVGDLTAEPGKRRRRRRGWEGADSTRGAGGAGLSLGSPWGRAHPPGNRLRSLRGQERERTGEETARGRGAAGAAPSAAWGGSGAGRCFCGSPAAPHAPCVGALRPLQLRASLFLAPCPVLSCSLCSLSLLPPPL